MRQPKLRTAHNGNNESTVPSSTYVNTDIAIIANPYVLAFIKTIDANTNSQGWRFQIRAKMLFTEGIQKVKKLNYKQQTFSKLDSDLTYSFATMVQESPRRENLGADISTLIRLLEEGEF